jgi:hypothetical protein
VLDNLSFLNRSLVDQEQELSTFLTSTTGFAGEMGGFLRENEQRFVTLAADSLPNLEVLARYSPEFPCLADGLARQEIAGEKVFGGLQPGLHITLEFTPNQGGYVPGEDEPVLGEDRGPTCFGLEGEPIIPFPAYYEPVDGYCDEEEAAEPGVQTGNCREPESEQPAPPAVPTQGPAQALAARSGPAAEQAAIGAAVGPVMGLAPGDVPDLAVLLFGPVARGTTVGLAPGD